MDATGNEELNYCYNCMTHLKSEDEVCPVCGHNNSIRQNPENALPEGTILAGKYLVGRVLGQGGFGITYLGFDTALKIKVAIKEYFPIGVSVRSPFSIRVTSVSSQTKADGFRKGCDEFQEEAQRLAAIESPNIVKVRDYFRENGTAYIVMNFVDGSSLTKEAEDCGGRMPWKRVVDLFKPLILELDKLHKAHMIHRDIKPDNIKVVKDDTGTERLVLLDFGAARSFVSAEVTGTYSAFVSFGYAPIEQYNPKSRQGPYTDIYALCATMYAVITGSLPADSTDRMLETAEIMPFSEMDINMPQKVEKAIFHGLAVRSADRPQSMMELYNELCGKDSVSGEPTVIVEKTVPEPQKEEKKEVLKPPEEIKPKKKTNWLLPVLLAVLLAAGFFLYRGIRQNQLDTAATQTAESGTSTRSAQELAAQLTADAQNTQTVRAGMTQQAAAAKTQQARETQEALHVEQTGTAWNITAAAEYQQTQTREAIEASATQAERESRMEQTVQVETQWALDTQEALSREQTATAWFTTQEAQLHQTQTREAEEIQQTAASLARQTVAAEQTRMVAEQQTATQAAIYDMQTRTAIAEQTAAALEQTRVMEKQQTATQAAIYDMQTRTAIAEQTMVAEQTAAALEQTRVMEEQQTATQAAIYDMQTRTAIAEQTARAEQTLTAMDRTREAIEIAQTEIAETREAFDIIATQNAWQQTQDAIHYAQTEIAGTQNAFYATQTKMAEPTATPTPTMTASATPTAAASFTPTKTNTPISTATPAPSATATPKPAVMVGDVFTFGRYEQDGDLTNGAEAIEWQVLAVEDGRALVISKYGLDAKPFNERHISVTWETSTLRAWLNGEFYNSAFSNEEQGRIRQVTIKNPDNVTYGTKGGNDTTDRIFLLSIDEAEQYFVNDEAQKCQATTYAKNHGAWAVEDFEGTSFWWLRSPGKRDDMAARVHAAGGIDFYGRGVYVGYTVVRPAFWLDPDEEPDIIDAESPMPTETGIPAVDVIVTISGHRNTAYYDGDAHTVSGYDVEISDPSYTETDFLFSGTAEAKRTNAGTTYMGLRAEQFSNTNSDFGSVTFIVNDGYQTVAPIDVEVDIIGNHNISVYDGREHIVSGYAVASSSPLYSPADISFSGSAEAVRTNVGTTNMGLSAAQFANNNVNFDNVTFSVTDGYQTITAIDEVTVTIIGNQSIVNYDGEEHSVSGFDVEVSDPLYTEGDFSFSGTAEAVRTHVGTTNMGLKPEQFANNSSNFDKVSFIVTDGYQTVNPINAAVTINGHRNTVVYDGEVHSISGYNTEISEPLYSAADFSFSGTAEAERMEVGTTFMELSSEQFTNTNPDFGTVTFIVNDGYMKVDPLPTNTPAPTAVPKPSVKAGDIITLGQYEQDNNPDNGPEAIEWQVLSVEDGRALVISKYALDAKPYNDKVASITWEQCTLRTWLNGEFYNIVFSSEEKGLIQQVTLANPNNKWYGTEGGNDTADRIFLLSIDEAGQYFLNDEARKCWPTAYAKNNGAAVIESRGGTTRWYLRTPGGIPLEGFYNKQTYVGAGGHIELWGGSVYTDPKMNTDRSSNYYGYATRPAFWLNLDEGTNNIISVKQEPTATAMTVLTADRLTVGDIITMGHFEQNDNLNNGPEAIDWQVLAVEDDRALVISKYGLDIKPYNTENTSVTWETSTLRAWLNGEFYSSSFSSEEKDRILEVTLRNPDSSYKTEGGNDTRDRIFLLSLDEAKQYFSDNEARKCWPTWYAKNKGARRFGSEDGGGNWWLRSPGAYSNCTYEVSFSGEFYEYTFVDKNYLMVRPAFWLELSTETDDIDSDSPEPVSTPASTPVPTQTPAQTAVPKRVVNIGDIITFGQYEQDNDPDNGPEAIEWQVLAVEDGRALVISKYGLDAKKYNDTRTSVTWETSTLRAWLNGEFYNSAFSSDEKAQIRETTLKNPNNKYNTNGGNKTRDRIFLLSYDEATEYFADNAARKCQPTAYTKNNGAGASYGGAWWLRSPGAYSICAYEINYSGSFYEYVYVNNNSVMARPAFWLDLGTETEKIESDSPEPTEAPMSEPTVTPVLPAVPKTPMKAGDIITLGHYEQDNNPDNGPESIEWQVLAAEDGRTLVISKYGLDAKRYNEEYTSTTWKTCSLRAWLNEEFYNSAFSNEEKGQIQQVTNTNPNNANFGTKGGNDTTDRIFLLSIDEAEQFFSDDETRKCWPTEYAKNNDAYISEDDGDTTWWWLRSPGSIGRAVCINTDGSFREYGTSINTFSVAVRPAFWLDLSGETESVATKDQEPTSEMLPTSEPTEMPTGDQLSTSSLNLTLLITEKSESGNYIMIRDTILREQPSISATALFSLLTGEKVIPQGKNKNSWILINTMGDSEGWLPEEGWIPEDSVTKEEQLKTVGYTTIPSTDLKASDIFLYGKYEQDNDLSNGAEPIEWQVLAVENGQALVVSRYGLNAKAYNDEKTFVTWSTCSLRQWLNDDFFSSAFSSEEQDHILETIVKNPNNTKYGTAGGKDTKDRIFLLSGDEVEKYFADAESRKCESTAYAKANGAMVSSWHNWTHYGWWLRTPGYYGLNAMYVDTRGSVGYRGYDVNYTVNTVRPAFWLDL